MYRLVGAALLLVAVPSACAPGETTRSRAPVPSGAGSSSARVAVSPAADPLDPVLLGALRVVKRLPAWDAQIVGASVVVVEPDLLTVAAYDRASGASLWRVKTANEKTGGRHTLLIEGNHLIYWAGDVMIGLDPSSGNVVSTEHVPFNDDCSFQKTGDACAFSCQCSSQLAACDTGKAIGKRFDNTYVEMFGADGEPPNAGCFGGGSGLVGGASGVSVMEVEDASTPTRSFLGHDHVMLGLDAVTGRELWRSKALAHGSTSEEGIAGAFAYQVDSDGALTIFDVRNGKPTVRRAGAHTPGRVPRSNLQIDAGSGRVFHSLEREAVLLDPRTGRVVWSQALPDGATAIIEGGAIQSYSLGGGDVALAIIVLDPKTGAPKGSFTVPPHAYLHADPAGGFYVAGPVLTAYDANGVERAHLDPMDPPNVSPGIDYAALFSKDDLAILSRAHLERVGALRGSYAVQNGSSLATTLLVYRFIDEGKQPGEAILLSRPMP